MVDADKPRLIKTAGRAHPGGFFQGRFLGLDSSDENKHRFFLVSFLDRKGHLRLNTIHESG